MVFLNKLSTFFRSLPVPLSLVATFFFALGIYLCHLKTSLIVSIFLTLILLIFSYFNQKNVSDILSLSAKSLLPLLLGSLIFHYHATKNSTLPNFFKSCNFSVSALTKTGNVLWPYRLTARLESFTIKDNEETILAHDSIYIYTRYKPHVSIDDKVSCSYLGLKVAAFDDFGLYLHKESIAGCSFVSFLKIKLIERPSFSIHRQISEFREEFLKRIQKKLNFQSSLLFNSLFVGDKTKGKKSLETYKSQFQQWGISHYLAKSGLHLVIFIIIWLLLISCIPGHFFIKQCFMIIVCALYYLLTPASISFLRAFCLFILSKLCTLLGWQVNTIHLMCIICCTTLFFNPFNILFLDFQLSFFLTFCLAWISYYEKTKAF